MEQTYNLWKKKYYAVLMWGSFVEPGEMWEIIFGYFQKIKYTGNQRFYGLETD